MQDWTESDRLDAPPAVSDLNHEELCCCKSAGTGLGTAVVIVLAAAWALQSDNICINSVYIVCVFIEYIF